jgi:hypothetical protein
VYIGRHSLAITRLAVVLASSLALFGQNTPQPAPKNIVVANVTIPRIHKAPTLEAFASMKPSPDLEGTLAVLDNFTQREPKDGAPAISKTVAYMGYDEKNFYTVFVCFDSDPKSVRSRLARRDTIGPEDDEVQLYLDTFDDRQRSYGFMTNPHGVQFDYLWTEQNGYDVTYDAVWDSKGMRTSEGWVAMMVVPFKSIRFSRDAQQKWGILLQRVVPRTSENLFWPAITKNKTGRLTQEGEALGLANISPGRNMQFIPYGVLRSYHAPDLRDPSSLHSSDIAFRGRIGLDSKIVIKDSFVFDSTINPDFSQVESDDPQVTVNQRFEVFFPEKRPFFLENANYFSTPVTLLFTRRIADPKLGLRLTGKKGPWGVGLMFADDKSPGEVVPDNDPLRGKRAYFGVARLTRDLFKQSKVGLTFTERQFEGSYNRVASIDTHLVFKDHWTVDGQAIASQTKFLDGTHQAGPMYFLYADYTDKHTDINSLYQDTGQGFLTQTGFFQQPSIRWFSNYGQYYWRPEGKVLIDHGFSLYTRDVWDRGGLRLTEYANANYRVDLPRSTQVGAYYNIGHEQVKPTDFPDLIANRDIRYGHQGFFFNSFYFRKLSINGEVGSGSEVNYVPKTGGPNLARTNYAILFLTVKPTTSLTIDNTYFLTRLREYNDYSSIFTNHIIRSKWNYQFTPALSLRFIAQYTSTLANPLNTVLTTGKNMNADFLVTWLVHPGTAVYVGYNSNLANPDPLFNGPGLPPNRYVNDSKGLFVKASYLFRF